MSSKSKNLDSPRFSRTDPVLVFNSFGANVAGEQNVPYLSLAACNQVR